ncbi:hypothetical protein [Nocardia sp. NPDC057227]|uniref:hypothetical protein n=1 Tax=Nocardia sp. NPDC057227 TaxID=3346056 RepID=UPI003644E1FA
MAGRRRGWFGSSGRDEWIEQARAGVVAAFLDMDRRQSAADSAVLAVAEVRPDPALARRWEPVRNRCYAAAGVYLALNDDLEAAERDGTPVPGGAPRAEQVTRQLAEAARAVDEFWNANRARLEDAVAVLGAVPRFAEEVSAEAERVLGAAASSEYAGYRSIRSGVAAVDEALLTLAAATTAGPGRVRAAATALRELTALLSEALAQAPSRRGAAANAIASVTTRIAAVRTRAEGLAAAYSALLREFNAASSADLTNNERESQQAVAAADTALAGARAAAAAHDPETALELTTSARASLAAAEQQVDAVTRRLTLLREVAANPNSKAEAVRFRLRDAQMLAVSRGLVAEWGSVLDAQIDRIDRAAAALTGRHPNYWAYVTELDTIAEFITGVVDRMRKEPGHRRG